MLYTSLLSGRIIKRKGLSSRKAVDKAYAYTSRPVLANALGLSVGLSVLLFSPPAYPPVCFPFDMGINDIRCVF